MMKLHTIAFGCQMSVADTDEMSRPWLEWGFSRTQVLADADAVIVGTCTVRQHAEDRAVSQIGRLRKWKEKRPERFLIVAGCAAERIRERLKERFPYIDLIVGARSIERYREMLAAALKERFDRAAENRAAWNVPRESAAGGTAGADCARGFITIMRGCNYCCSYCVVPSVRGREIYRGLDTILAEVRERVRAGIPEVTFLGQTVNSYRDRAGADFADLLRAAQEVEGLERIRFMSPHPHYLGERMMRAMAECPKLARHLHLPIQSGSDRVLAAMRRNYTRRSFLEKTAALRGLIPDLALSTDLIVGFPGETEAEFKETLSLVKEADFCAAYCYKFSAREGTPAAAISGVIPEANREERLQRLLAAVRARTAAHLGRLTGERVRVLLETETDGRTQYHFKARLSEPRQPGRIIEAEVDGSTATALRCRPLT